MHKEIKVNKGICNILIETFEFTDEELAAIDCQIPMTQEIYDSILDRCMELGTAADDLFYRMLLEYPDFLPVYAQKIEDEVNEKYADIDIPESSPEELDAVWEDLCRRIREKYVNNGELVPSARSNCTTLPKQEYRLAGWLYRSATALC